MTFEVGFNTLVMKKPPPPPIMMKKKMTKTKTLKFSIFSTTSAIYEELKTFIASIYLIQF